MATPGWSIVGEAGHRFSVLHSRAAVAVAHHVGAEGDRLVDGRPEIGRSPAELASTSRMWQLGQIGADHVEVEGDLLAPSRVFAGGIGACRPVWLTLRKQPLAVVQAGRPKKDRYAARSASA